MWKSRARVVLRPAGRGGEHDAEPQVDHRLPAVSSVVLGVLLTVATVASVLLVLRLHASPTAAVLHSPAKYVYVIVVDGIGPDALKGGGLPTMHHLMVTGTVYDRAWVGQAETVPVTSGASIGTGTFPRRHGVVGNVWRTGNSGKLTRLDRPGAAASGLLDAVLQNSSVPTLAGELRQARSGARTLSVGGEGCGAASALGGPLADYVVCPSRMGSHWLPYAVPGHEIPGGARSLLAPRKVASGPGLGPSVEGWRLGAQDEWISQCALKAVRLLRPTLTFITFPEPALVLRYAPARLRSRLLAQVLHGIDGDLARLVALAHRTRTFSRSVFLLTSLRGLAAGSIRLSTASLDEAILAGGGERMYVASDTGAYLGLRDVLQAPPVAQAVSGANLAFVDSVYYKTVTGKRVVYRAQNAGEGGTRRAAVTAYLLGTLANADSPDVAVIYRPGMLAGDAPVGRWHWQSGSLGFYQPEQRIPLVVAGEGVGAGVVSHFPARLVDIAPTVAMLLGFDYRGGDGVVLADGLAAPTSSELSRQRRAGRLLRHLEAGLG